MIKKIAAICLVFLCSESVSAVAVAHGHAGGHSSAVHATSSAHAGMSEHSVSAHIVRSAYHPVYVPHAAHQQHSDDGWYEYKEPITLCPVSNSSIVCLMTGGVR